MFSRMFIIGMFMQAVVRFLWDAHNCEEAREEEELVVSTPYIEHWNDLIDLWYLGMQVSCQRAFFPMTFLSFINCRYYCASVPDRMSVILSINR
jgi:hypothetical protein